MYKRILVAVDGSENSKRAAEHAALLAGLNPETHVEVLYVKGVDRTRKDASLKTDDINRDVNRDAHRDFHKDFHRDTHSDEKNTLGPIKGTFENNRIDYELIIEKGDPGSTIVSYANRGGFDLVIIGSRGFNAFKEMLLGSVSLKVVRRVKVPVMIIK